MTAALTIQTAPKASFRGRVIVPALAPETPGPETAGKEVGDVRLLEGKLILSLGPKDKVHAEAIRRAGGSLARWLARHNVHEAGLDLAPLLAIGLPPATAVHALCEGLLLGAFVFDQYKSDARTPTPVTVVLLSEDRGAPSNLEELIRRATIVCESVNLAREWAHQPPNVINPVTLAERVTALAGQYGLKCTVLDDRQLEAMGAGAIVAVGKGSATPSRLIVLEHEGRGGAPVALIGKALTFDTGGYSIKPVDGIVGMKYDKCGGMAVLATLIAAARLGIPTRVVGLIAAAENMISDVAYRPNDILKSLAGKTIEVISADAEGRLVLCDTLTYAQREFKPRIMIDLATLTGGVIIALGSTRAGLFSNNEELANALFEIGERVHERLWRLPLDDEYFELIKGDDSDMKNSSGVRKAHPIVGAIFLKQFVPDEIPWAHLDIAGVADVDKETPYCPKGATGFGVRLLMEYLETLQ